MKGLIKMSWYNNLKIGKKLIISFALVALFSGIVGIVGVINMTTLTQKDAALYKLETMPLGDLSDMTYNFNIIRTKLRDIILDKDMETKKSHFAAITENASLFKKAISDYKKNVFGTGKKEAFSKVEDNFAAYMKMSDQVVKYALAEDAAAALSTLRDKGFIENANIINKGLIDLANLNRIGAKNKSTANKNTANSSIKTMIAIIIAAVIIGIIIGIFIARTISQPINKAAEMMTELGQGHLDVRLNMETKDEVGQMAMAMDKFAEDLKINVVGSMKKIAGGDLNFEITSKDDRDEISPALKTTITSLRSLIDESSTLTEAALKGHLSVRGNSSKFSGGYKDIVDGVNNTLDAVIGPLNVAADYVERIGKGDLPPKIKDKYNGDFNDIKDNLNLCIANINELINDSNMLEKAALEGQLDTRADITKHSGKYRNIVNGINKTLDAAIEPIKEASNVLEEMAKGNLKVQVAGNYVGDHAKIKKSLNFTVNNISQCINEISSVLNEMAAGNLNLGITSEYLGDFVQIKNAINMIIESFNNMLSEINIAAEQVSEGAKQISSSGQSLSQGSTEQASSIEELTSSMADVSTQTKKNAENANNANELTNMVQTTAKKGNEQMQLMLNAMDEINKSSLDVSKIIKVIDEIAFQTNILALNAAVEAARAGHHGKGFAVVAEEVRNLAARSANASKETTSMIEGSLIKVEEGRKIAHETAEALSNIVEGVVKTSNIVGEISDASNKQAAGFLQINQGINQVSEVTQTNSATAQESASASEELSNQAGLLKEMVRRFRLKNSLNLKSRRRDLNKDIIHNLDEQIPKKTLDYKKSEFPEEKEPAISLNSDSDLTSFSYGKY